MRHRDDGSHSRFGDSPHCWYKLASEFLQLLSDDGQTIDNDIQRRADAVTTSVQFHSLGRALMAKQLGQARMDAQYCSRPVFFDFLCSEGDPESVAERVQQQTVEVPMPQILKETVEIDELVPFDRVQQRTVDVPVSQILEETVEVTQYVAPAPAFSDIACAPVIEHVSSTPGGARICRHLFSACSIQHQLR